mmetsp:Transcript_18619/g.44855  ORF Transcript_18619/g.44855 Transcript_18619/m.44855 type:complete len:85 (+) Transcript_18619:374-628(+)
MEDRRRSQLHHLCLLWSHRTWILLAQLQKVLQILFLENGLVFLFAMGAVRVDRLCPPGKALVQGLGQRPGYLQNPLAIKLDLLQ